MNTQDIDTGDQHPSGWLFAPTIEPPALPDPAAPLEAERTPVYDATLQALAEQDSPASERNEDQADQTAGADADAEVAAGGEG